MKERTRRSSSALVAALFIVTGPARGDEADTPAGDRTERSSREPGEPVEEYVVTGIRSQRLVARPSAFSSTIEVDDYDGENKSVADLLGEQVGVQIRRFGGPGEPAEVSIRGSTGSQVVIKLDGVRMNSALSGATDISQLCLGLIDSAEITRGGDAVRSGDGSIGGSVALRSRRAGAKTVNRAQISGGAFGTWEADVLRSGRAGPLEYGVGYCGFTTDGDYSFARPDIQVQTQAPSQRPPIIRINNHRVRHSGNISLGGEVGEHGHVQFSDYLTYSSQGEPGLDAGAGAFGGQNPYAHAWSTHNLARLAYSAEDLGVFGDTFEASVHHRYQRLAFDDSGVSANDAPVSTLTQVHTFGLDAEDAWSFDALAADHELTLLVDARRDVLYDDDVSDVGRTNAGIAIQEEARWLSDRILLVPGVRLEWVQGLGETWLPALGVVLTPLPWLRIKGNIQETFRAPSFDELFLPNKGFIRGNPNLRPEQARNVDAGLMATLDELGPVTDLRFEGGVFQQDIDDSIVWIPVSPRTIEPNNTGPARVRGYELSLELSVTRFVQLVANHTGLETESLTTGLPLPGRADNETLVRLRIGEKGRWKLVGEMQRTGEIPVSPSGAIRLPSRVLWSTSAAVNLAGFEVFRLPASLRELWLYATLTNLSDVAVRDALFFPQPGRSGFLGAEIEW